MNTLEIKGGRKDQREMAHTILGIMINTMMPRMRTLDIEVEFVNIKSDAVGFCMEGENNRQFFIEIDKKQNLKDIVTTLCHEMVHVKQDYRKDNRTIKEKEKEAYEQQEVLYERWLENDN